MKRFLSVLAFILLLSAPLLAQQDSTRPRLTDFIKEVQQTDDRNHGIKMVLWIPWQYWETALVQANNGKPLTETSREMVNSLKQYTVMCIVDAKIGPYGFSYFPESEIRDSIRLVIEDSVTLRPLEEKTLNETMSSLLMIMRPMMSSMLGQMGDHLSFFVFENTMPDGKRYINAEKPGKFSLTWKESASFSWRLPLDALTPPKYCPVDNEKLSGKFDYCPYHGRKLKTTK